MLSDFLETMGRSIHDILSSDTVETDVKETGCDCGIWEVIVEVCNLSCTPCTDLEDVCPLKGDYGISEKTRWSRQHLCCNSLHRDVRPRFCFRRSVNVCDEHLIIKTSSRTMKSLAPNRLPSHVRNPELGSNQEP